MTKREYYNLVCSMIRDGHVAWVKRVLSDPVPKVTGMRPIHYALVRLALRNNGHSELTHPAAPTRIKLEGRIGGWQ